MGILTWIVLGLVSGVIAKFLMPGDQEGGWIKTILLGIVGALLGGFIGNYFGFGGVDGFNFKSVVVATVGALLLLIPGRILKKI